MLHPTTFARRLWPSRRLAHWLAVVAAWAVAACNDDALVAAPTATADVLAAPPDAASEVGSDTSLSATSDDPGQGARVVLLADAVAGDELTVSVRLFDIPDLYGIAGQVVFDPTALQLIDLQGETILGDTGWAPVLLARAMDDRVLLGGARVRDASGSGPLAGAQVGHQRWATMRFRKLGSAPTTLAFDPARRLARAGDYSVVSLHWGSLTLTGGGR